MKGVVKMEEKKKLPTTHKKQKFIRIKEYIDPETGEYIPFQENAVEDRDFNFHKVWLRMFVEELDRIANKKMRLAFWIVDHLDSENKLVYTFRRMAEETGLSIDTVIKTMKTLQEGNPPFLKKLQSGVYVINPDILYKGNHKSRMGIVYQFGEIPSKYAMEQKAKAEEKKKPSEETASDAPESPQTHEKTDAKENVPEESETPKKGKFTRKFTPEPFIEKDREGFPEFVGFPEVCLHAANIRNYLWSEFVYKSEYNKNPKLNDKITDKIIKAFYDNGNPEWWRQFHGKTFQEFCDIIQK